MPRDKMLKLIRKEATKKVNLKDLLADGIRIKRGLL
jgi:hypothetical protein